MSFIRLAYKIVFHILCCKSNQTLFFLPEKKPKHSSLHLNKGILLQLFSSKTLWAAGILFFFGIRSEASSYHLSTCGNARFYFLVLGIYTQISIKVSIFQNKTSELFLYLKGSYVTQTKHCFPSDFLANIQTQCFNLSLREHFFGGRGTVPFWGWEKDVLSGFLFLWEKYSHYGLGPLYTHSGKNVFQTFLSWGNSCQGPVGE